MLIDRVSRQLLSCPELSPLVRELDAQAHGLATRTRRAAVGSLHDSGAAARDHGDARLGQLAPHMARGTIHRVRARRARGAKDGHGRPQLSERTKAVHELRLDAQDAPGVHV